VSGASRRQRLAASRGPERPRPPPNGSSGQVLLERSAVEMPLGVRRRKRLADRLRPRLHTGALGSLDHVAGAGFQVAAGATATKAAKELGLVRTESAECC
jgi:hypothetical protein